MSFFDRIDPPDAGTELEAWLERELRRPVHLDPEGKSRLMACVRAEPLRPRPAPVPGHKSGARTRYASPIIGILLAASFVGLISTNALRSITGRGARDAPAVGRAGLADSMATTMAWALQSTFEDTLRLVRFMLVAPTAARVALVGDFNAWNPASTPLTAIGEAEWRGVWAVTVALAQGRHRYAYVVDDTQWRADPAAPHGESRGGRLTSFVDVTMIR